MNSKPDDESAAAGVPDPELLAAHDLALAALREITPDSTIGPAAGYALEADGVVSLRFETTLAGYPGWFWTVTLARVEGEAPTVLEAELLPGEGALLAPEWVPWAVRLADYQAQVAAEAARRAEEDASADDEPDTGESDDDFDEDDEDDELDDDLDEDDELDEDDDDDGDDLEDDDEDDVSPVLHSGDLDGVDIDELDEDEADEDDDEDED